MDRLAKLKEFLAQNPADNFVQHALALELIKIGDEAGAREQFLTLLGRDENYIGSYYHLAKLLERTGEKEAAIHWYEKGMQKSKEAGDRHAYSELQAAYEDLVD